MLTMKPGWSARWVTLDAGAWRQALALLLHASIAELARHRAQRLQRLELASMSEYELHDLGLSREQAAAALDGIDVQPRRR